MRHSRQDDLFAPEPDLFGPERASPVTRADPDKVRARLREILAETRAAAALPQDRVRLYRTIVPQMSRWLPDEEAARLRREFESEMARFEGR